eukprot:scaffold30615_cov64-Phaeocystis_antarctica.AAC.11
MAAARGVFAVVAALSLAERGASYITATRLELTHEGCAAEWGKHAFMVQTRLSGARASSKKVLAGARHATRRQHVQRDSRVRLSGTRHATALAGVGELSGWLSRWFFDGCRAHAGFTERAH